MARFIHHVLQDANIFVEACYGKIQITLQPFKKLGQKDQRCFMLGLRQNQGIYFAFDESTVSGVVKSF